MCGSMVDIQSPTAEIRRGKKERRRNHMMKIYVASLLHRAAIKKKRNRPTMQCNIKEFCSLSKAVVPCQNKIILKNFRP